MIQIIMIEGKHITIDWSNGTFVVKMVTTYIENGNTKGKHNTMHCGNSVKEFDCNNYRLRFSTSGNSVTYDNKKTDLILTITKPEIN